MNHFVPLIYVLSIIFSIAFIGLVGVGVAHFIEQSKNRKHTIVPKSNYPENGICQCSDALCYHADGPCSVRNCNCQVYIPSMATEDDLNIMQSSSMHRLMLAASTAKAKYEEAEATSKRKAIEASRYR